MIRLFSKKKSEKLEKKSNSDLEEKVVVSNEEKIDNEQELAAAFIGLHLYLTETTHIEESNILTIQRIQRRYSPWSSKIYSINNFQR